MITDVKLTRIYECTKLLTDRKLQPADQDP